MSVEIKNKKASFTYFLEDEFIAGIQLNGCEIKSIRNGKASIAEAYCKMEKGEMWVINMYVEAYPNGGYTQQNPRRSRKLLLTKTEIKKLDKDAACEACLSPVGQQSESGTYAGKDKGTGYYASKRTTSKS